MEHANNWKAEQIMSKKLNIFEITLWGSFKNDIFKFILHTYLLGLNMFLVPTNIANVCFNP